MIVTDLAPLAFQRVSWNESQSVLQTSLFGAGIIFLLTLALWPAGALIRRHYGRSLEFGQPERRLRLPVRLTCALDLLVIVGWLLVSSLATHNLLTFLSSRMVPLFWLLEGTSFIGALATIIVFYQFFKSWATTGRWIWAKVADTAILLACLAFVWVIWVGHMANFNLCY